MPTTIYQIEFVDRNGRIVNVIEKVFLRESHRADARRWARESARGTRNGNYNDIRKLVLVLATQFEDRENVLIWVGSYDV